jgi:hypothetical protein
MIRRDVGENLMKMFFQFALLAGAVVFVSDRAYCADETELAAYASIYSMAQGAEKNCKNTYASDAAILVLKEENHVTDKDNRALKGELAKLNAEIERQIKEEGAATWCKTIIQQYGPNGSVQKILITR